MYPRYIHTSLHMFIYIYKYTSRPIYMYMDSCMYTLSGVAVYIIIIGFSGFASLPVSHCICSSGMLQIAFAVVFTYIYAYFGRTLDEWNIQICYAHIASSPMTSRVIDGQQECTLSDYLLVNWNKTLSSAVTLTITLILSWICLRIRPLHYVHTILRPFACITIRHWWFLAVHGKFCLPFNCGGHNGPEQ